MIFGFPMALFPAIAEELGHGSGAGVLGLLYAAPALGRVPGDAVLGPGEARPATGPGDHARRVAVWGAAIVVFGLSDTLWLSLAMLTIAGAGDMVSGIFRMTILQAAVDDSIRGRLDGIGMAVWATGPSLGELESGVVASIWSVPVERRCSGGLLTILGVGAARGCFVPAFARYDAQASRAVESARVLAFNADVYNGLKFIHVAGAPSRGSGAGSSSSTGGRASAPHRDARSRRRTWRGRSRSSTPWFMRVVACSCSSRGSRWSCTRPGSTSPTPGSCSGLLGYAATFVTGIFLIRPTAEKLAASGRERGPDVADDQALIARIFAISRVDQVVLLLVILDMVFKPGA